MCVNFVYYERRDQKFKVNSERQIFEKLFMAILFTLRFFSRNLLKGSRQRNIFTFSFWWLTWDSKRGLTSNKLTHYFLEYSAFNMYIHICLLSDGENESLEFNFTTCEVLVDVCRSNRNDGVIIGTEFKGNILLWKWKSRCKNDKQKLQKQKQWTCLHDQRINKNIGTKSV